eukprot:CAMPEP_0198678758 /NCGR_PEP_ID=MMETSP1468-20131203/1420_1 /TAXON_ID=1461545 /ORGANISM="Mantoniella sp, Strain CCMP1436" /LENGTH=62 /DNA_ID=CAMNT_0044416511 /DNA_START=249 /DNA_END=438 /DNA_ORIENTATION=-
MVGQKARREDGRFNTREADTAIPACMYYGRASMEILRSLTNAVMGVRDVMCRHNQGEACSRV